MNFLKNAKALIKMLTPLSIFMFWACSISASPIDKTILSPSFKNRETSVVIDDVCANPNANVKGGTNSIKIKGITTKSAAIQIFNSAWVTVYNQQVSSDSVTISNLSAGTYNVKVTVLQLGGKWPAVCSVLVNNVNVVTGVNPCNTDKQAPVFANCPQNINLTTSTTTAVARWTPPTATDNCTATPSVSSNYNSGFAFPIGSKTVTYTAADAKGNKATCSFIVSVVQNNNCRYSDSLALVDVYNNMGGSNWISTKWDLTKSIENWIGVQLDSNGCVRLLVLSEASGAISPSIGKLSQLEILYLNTGKITDTLPSSLGNLSKLKQFYSYGGKITGKIPSSFGNMASMEELILESNQLSGNIPSSLGNLKKLRLLVLRYNKLTGNIPNSFVNMTSLESLLLSDNLLSGTLPANLSKIPKIFTLDLSRNQFTGCIPNDYKVLCGKNVVLLGNLDLPNNGDFISFCSNGVGDCSSSGLCQNDTIRPYFTRCLSDFYVKTSLDSASVTWIVPNAFDNCGTPIVVSNFKPADKFAIGANNIVYTATDANANKATCEFKIIVAKDNCRQLDSLSLVDFFNSTNGTDWKEKWDLNKPIDTWIGVILDANGCVKDLNLNYNNLNGSLPQTIGNLTSLQRLILSDSLIIGNLPISLGSLSNLEVLSIQGARITGDIPTSLGYLRNLKSLIISSTQLSGSIPISLSYLKNLKQIFLVDNKLTGSIPPELGDLPNLSQLYLHTNQLSGCIPSILKKLCGKSVDISNNPNLPNGGDWLAFCNTGAGACTASSDLALSISTINANYSPYTTVNFKIKVENKGSNSMTAIKIRFAYPPQTANGGRVTPSVGTWKEYCSGGILCYEWTIPTLDVNAVATLDVPLFILATSTPIVANVNLLNSTPVDTEVSNNTATVSIAPPASPAQFLTTPNRPKPSQYIPIVIQTVAPNPTEGDVLIEIESIVEKEVRFDFYNTLGKIVKSEIRAVKKGENYLQFDFWNETNGVYFIQTNVGQGRGVPLKFVKL